MTDTSIENKVMDGDKLIDEALGQLSGRVPVNEPEENNEPDEVDDVDESEAVEDVATDEESEDTSKPKGYDPVDLNSLPPEMRGPVRDRINHLYKQTKRTDEKNQLLARQNEELSRTLNEVLDKFEKIESKESSKAIADAKEALIERYQQAALNEDHRAMATISAEIAKLDMQPVKEKQEVRQPVKQAVPYSEDDIAYVEDLASGADGKQRPWLSSSNFELYRKAQEEGARITREYISANGRQPSIGKLMMELDKTMTRLVNPQPIKGGGISGNSNADLTKNKTAPKLTDKDREIFNKLGVAPKYYEKNQNLLARAKSRIVSIEDF